MLSSRQKLILKAIVEEYIKDPQPVGSKVLTSKPYLNFSSATLRYDMAQLEELGFLEKTHTSSGRVPSDKGYRYYVENLVTRDQGVLDTFPLIDDVFAKNQIARESAVKASINLLSELTNYTVMAIGPSASDDKLKRIDYVPIDDHQAVVLIVTERGYVQHQNIMIPEDVESLEVQKVIRTLDDLLRNRTLEEAQLLMKNSLAKKEIADYVDYQAKIVESFIEAFAKFSQENLYLSGITNVFSQPEFHNVESIKGLVDMLDRRELVKLIGSTDSLMIQFASDIKVIPMENYTVISVPYQISETEKGKIAVLGPSRMEYGKVIPLVEYVAVNLGKLYKKKKE